MSKGIKRKLYKAQKEVDKLISGFSKRGGMYAPAMAGEGYNGGYRDALADVLLLLNGCSPCMRPEFWMDDE